METTKFKIGDEVRVVNSGKTYTRYEKMFEKMGFKDKKRNYFGHMDSTFTVFNVDLKCDWKGITLYAIRSKTDPNYELLISEDGLELHWTPKMGEIVKTVKGEHIFLFEKDGVFHCVGWNYDEEFEDPTDQYLVVKFNSISRIEQPTIIEVTFKEISEMLAKKNNTTTDKIFVKIIEDERDI